MSDSIYIGLNTEALDTSPQFQPFSRVIIHTSEDTSITVGNDSGRTLEFDNPFGTKQMAQDILNRLSGIRYQPYEANGALIDPAAEIGDALETQETYGGIYQRNRVFTRLMEADVAAPQDEEIDHEFEFVPPEERKWERTTGALKASLLITSQEISAEVTRAKSAEENLSSRISVTASEITAEVTRATAAEGEMSSRITQTANGLAAEITNRTNADVTLRASIVANTTKIETEITNRTNADNSLSSRITQNANSITAEVTRATNAENSLSASISVQASQIAAKVSESGGGNSFSWTMNSTSHVWKANGSQVMKVSSGGLEVKGKVTATSGKIGGFDIAASSLQYNGLNWGDTDKNYGAYIGQSGIQLGKNFSVTNSGSVTARSLTLQGTLTFLNSDGTVAGTISAANLREGAAQAYSGYSGWNGTTATVNSNGGYWSGGAAGGFEYKSYFRWNENLGALEYYGGQTLYAPYVATNGGYRGAYWITDANGNNGHYSTLYYRTLAVMTGGSLRKQINWQTGEYDYYFTPQFTSILYVSAT